MKITNPITLDVARSNSYICLLAKQFDENSRFLIATLTNNGEPMIIPAGAAVTLRATRPDGEPVAVPGIINNDGTTTVEIDDYILEVVGSASLSIEVAIGDEILTSASFNLTIQRADGNGWLRVYVAAASLAAGNYYITIGGTSYAFTTTQAIPAGGSVYFASEGGTAQTRDADGNVLDASLPVSIASTGTELTSDVPTMSFLTAIAGRMATIEAEMSQKANIDGSYPLLNAGTADNLMTGNGATQAIPFIQEGTGKGNGEATVKAGGVLQLKKKLGNTVCVNSIQGYPGANANLYSKYGVTVSTDGNGNYTLTGTTTGVGEDKNWYIGITVPVIAGRKYIASGKTAHFTVGYYSALVGRDTTKGCFISQAGSTGNAILYLAGIDISDGITINETIHPVLSDLALWYGSNDRISSDLLAHPENWGRYYAGSLAYNAGTLESADGTILTSKGADGTTVLAEVDTGSEVLRSAGSVADEKTPDGTITRRVGVIDLGSLAWTKTAEENPRFRCETIMNFAKHTPVSAVANVKTPAYIAVSALNTYSGVVGISINDNGVVLVYDPSFSTAAAFKTAMSGIYLYYELATPTTEQGTAFAENIPCDPNGTLSWTQTKGIPQGNEIFYPADLKGAIESIVAAIPSANGTYTLHATVTTAGVTFSWS